MNSTRTTVTFKGNRGTALAYYVVEYIDITFVIWYDSIHAENHDKTLSKKEVKQLVAYDEDLGAIVMMCKRDLKSNYMEWKKNLQK